MMRAPLSCTRALTVNLGLAIADFRWSRRRCRIAGTPGNIGITAEQAGFTGPDPHFDASDP
jgi:hypothetical protein